MKFIRFKILTYKNVCVLSHKHSSTFLWCKVEGPSSCSMLNLAKGKLIPHTASVHLYLIQSNSSHISRDTRSQKSDSGTCKTKGSLWVGSCICSIC